MKQLMRFIDQKEGDVKRLFRLRALVPIISIPVLFCTPAFAEKNPSAPEDGPYFSNKDLEQYKMSSDKGTADAKTTRTGTKEEKAKGSRENQEQEYWCKKATSYKRKIERGHDEISETEKELSAKGLNRSKKVTLEKRLGKLKKEVAYTEEDLSDLEDEAHRKNIPPGWLRCQFE